MCLRGWETAGIAEGFRADAGKGRPREEMLCGERIDRQGEVESGAA